MQPEFLTREIMINNKPVLSHTTVTWINYPAMDNQTNSKGQNRGLGHAISLGLAHKTKWEACTSFTCLQSKKLKAL